MSQQQRPLTEAEERLRHYQRTHLNQPLPQPRNQEQLDERNRDRLRDLTRHVLDRLGLPNWICCFNVIIYDILQYRCHKEQHLYFMGNNFTYMLLNHEFDVFCMKF